MIFVNFKTYEEGTGEEALCLARICQETKSQMGVDIVPVVQAVDILRITQSVSLSVWVQHIDDIKFGPNTGRILPEVVKDAGASGTILNHSENKITPAAIKTTINRVQSLGMKVMVCCKALDEGEIIAKFNPDFLAYEPPQLIGSRGITVATAKPKVISDFVVNFPRLPIIVGAGIHSFQDVEISLKLGARGILVATDVVLAKDPKKQLKELARGFK
ncbi:MAG TPA: triose-phosphate isomerase [Candidatus Bathyarchaeia archaeon]|nr:triose-phosphate isomerase [Candidatus Bathyarchaeia archaeon]